MMFRVEQSQGMETAVDGFEVKSCEAKDFQHSLDDLLLMKLDGLFFFMQVQVPFLLGEHDTGEVIVLT